MISWNLKRCVIRAVSLIPNFLLVSNMLKISPTQSNSFLLMYTMLFPKTQMQLCWTNKTLKNYSELIESSNSLEFFKAFNEQKSIWELHDHITKDVSFEKSLVHKSFLIKYFVLWHRQIKNQTTFVK